MSHNNMQHNEPTLYPVTTNTACLTLGNVFCKQLPQAGCMATCTFLRCRSIIWLLRMVEERAGTLMLILKIMKYSYLSYFILYFSGLRHKSKKKSRTDWVGLNFKKPKKPGQKNQQAPSLLSSCCTLYII
jgi:hypothetical protein